MSTDQHTGRVAVITGASSGIGEATARALAADPVLVMMMKVSKRPASCTGGLPRPGPGSHGAALWCRLPGKRRSALRLARARRAMIGDAETLMARFLRRLPGPHAVQSVRVTVAWQRGRIRRIKLEYVRPHLIQRLINAVRW